MLIKHLKEVQRQKRHFRIRRKISGTQERPRLAISKSLKNIYIQLINDQERKTLLGLSTLSKAFKEKMKYGGNIKAAEALGELLATEAKRLGISKVVFDRSGNRYHGRIRAFADAARKGGLIF
jgi:large subunit ribosomal protein L18